VAGSISNKPFRAMFRTIRANRNAGYKQPERKTGLRLVNQWFYGLLVELARHVHLDMLPTVHFSGDLKQGE
jgi:hypothetical protein